MRAFWDEHRGIIVVALIGLVATIAAALITRGRKKPSEEIDVPPDPRLELAQQERRMGDISEEMIDFRGALGHYKKADEHLQTTDPVSEDRAEVLVDAGIKYKELAEYEAAIECYKQALAILHKDPEKNQVNIAAIYNNIANVYLDEGKLDDALMWYRKDLLIVENLLGEGHPDAASTYNNIAVMHEKQGEYDKALKWHFKALTIFEKNNKNHPITAKAYNNIALVHENQGKFDEALDWYEKALKVKEKSLGKKHPSIAKIYGNIANIYSKQNKLDQALEWNFKALPIFEKFDKSHPDTAKTYNNIANIYYRQDRLDEALALYKKAYGIGCDVLGEEHPETQGWRRNMEIAEQMQTTTTT